MKHVFLGTALAVGFMIAGCKPKEQAPNIDSKYAVMVMTDLVNNSGIVFTLSDKPSGTVDVSAQSRAKQLAETRNGGLSYGKAIYRGSNSLGEPGVQKYVPNATGYLEDAGFIPCSETVYNTHFHIVSSTLGFYSDRSQGDLKIYAFNPETMSKTHEIDLAAVSKKNGNAKVKVEKAGERMITSKEGKLFVDIQYDLNSNAFGSSAYDSVFMAVVDIATLKFDKLIQYAGAQEIGYSPNNMCLSQVDADGDLYIATMGNMTSSARNGKILRIRKGSTEFDNYEISIEDYVPGVGIKWFHGGAAVINRKLITGIKQTPFTDNYSNFNQENIVFHAIDLATKVATPIAGMPATDYVSICTPYPLDGKIMIPFSNSTGSGIYSYDGTTLKQEFKVSGGVVSSFFKITQ